MATKTTKKAADPPKTYASAMDKLRDEMADSKSGYIQAVGEYMSDYLLSHPEAEAAILDPDKSIKGSLKAMENYARKHKEGSVAVVDPETGFRIVREYFGIKTGADVPNQRPQTPAAPDPFDLDALMGGAL